MSCAIIPLLQILKDREAVKQRHFLTFIFPFSTFNLLISRRSEGGIAPVSGLNHRSRRRIFEKSRKPLKTLTFSALPNVEKSSISRSDHMFDHLQKNEYFYHIEV